MSFSLKSAKSLSESQFWLSPILDELEEGVRSLDATANHLLYLNTAAERIYGQGIEGFYHNSRLWLEVIHPEDLEKFQKSISKVIETGSAKIEYRIIQPSGEMHLLCDKLWGINNQNGELIRIDSILTDLTASVQGQAKSSDPELKGHEKKSILNSHARILEEKLEDSYFKKLVANLPAAIYEYNLQLDGTDYFSYISIGFCQIFELETEQIKQNSSLVWNQFNPDEQKKLRELISNSLATLTLWKWEGQIRTPSGKIKWLSGISQPRKEANGDVVWDGLLVDVSDRIQAQEKVKQQAQLLDQVRGLIVSSDLGGIVTSFNQGAEKLLGYTAAEVLGKHVSLWHTEEEHEFVIPEVIRQLQLKDQHEVEVKMRRKSGQIFEALLSLSLQRDSQGNAIGMIGHAIDISDRKETENKLRQSERHFRAIFNSTFQFIELLQPDGILLEANQTALNLAGIELKDVVGKAIWETPWWKKSQPAREQLKDAVAIAAKGELVRYEVEIVGRENSAIAIDFLLKPIFDEAGKVIMLLAEGRDITEDKRTRAELDNFFNLSGDLLCIAGFDGYFKRVNPAAQTILGYSSAEITSLPFLDLVHLEDRAATRAEIEKLTQGITTIAFENRYLKKDGSYKWLSWIAVPSEDLIYSVARDVSDRKATEIATRRLSHSLQEAQRIAHIGNWELDLATQSITWSEELFRIFGLDGAKSVPTFPEMQAMVHPEDRELHEQILEKAIAQGQYDEFDFRIYRPNGELRYINARGEVEKNEQGQVVRLFGIAMDITDRKKAEQALQEKEEFLRTIYDGVEQGIVVIDVLPERDFRYVGCNRAIEQAIGLSSAFICGKTPEDIYSPEIATQARINLMKCLNAGICITLEEYFGFTEEQSWWVTTFNPLRDATGRICRIVVTPTNITERKKIELALADREQFLRTIYDGVEYSIYVLDVLGDGNFRFADLNQAALRTGKSKEEQIIGKTLTEVMPPEMVLLWQQRYNSCIEACATITFEELYNDGETENWWFTSVTPLRNAENQIDRIVVTASNISDRKRAELALQHSEAKFRELAQREKLLNSLATQIRNSLDIDTILETTVLEIHQLFKIDLCVFTWYRSQENPPLWEVFKEAKTTETPSHLGLYTTEQVGPLAEKILNQEIICSSDVNQVSELLLRNSLVALGYKSILGLPLQTNSGEIGTFTCINYSKERDWSDSEVELLCAVREQLAIALNQAELYTVSRDSARIATAKSFELEKAMRQLQETQAQLIQSEKMSSLGQLVAGVAHEINNPVNFIYGNLIHASDYLVNLLELIKLYHKNYPQPTVEIEDKIEEIDLDFLIKDLPNLFDSMKVGADRIREIVRSLRTFSRLDEADMKAVDIHENIDSALMILQNRLKSKPDQPGITVIKEYGKLPLIECYAGQLNQVFMNLLSNAIDAINERKKELNAEEIQSEPGIINIATISKQNSIEIRIADNGIGMASEVVSKIFDPFYTTKPVGKGTGLGLSISYQIILEKHKGKFLVDSKPGQGTEFAIEIPKQQF